MSVLDLGAVVGRIEFDASGVATGLRSADTQLQQATGRWQQTAATGGKQAGTAAGKGIADGAVAGAEDAGKRSGSGFTRSLSTAVAGSAGMMATPFRSIDRFFQENEQQVQTAGLALGAFGASGALALKEIGGAAVQWESDWTGVLKTVDGTPAQLGAIEQGLRDMAKELPTSTTELAGIAEAAGQLGIETDNVLAFTRTIADLGETTNLSAEQGATELARFMNIMGTAQTETSNLGSSIVALGNNYASTESEIMSMAMRLAGAGRQAGLTEGDVLGLAAALSSVGIEAEAGGTAFSRVLIEMGTSVDTADAKLDVFASTAGMTSEAFAELFRNDPSEAITRFITGLGDVQASGESVQPILEELGMTDIRVGDALRRTAGGADIFTGAMDLGNEAYAENIALTEEAELRYGTLESKIATAKNAVGDAAISFGQILAPAIETVATWVSTAADAFGNLPPGLQEFAVYAGAIGTAVALAGSAFFLAGPRVASGVRAFRDLGGVVTSGLASRIGTVRLHAMYAGDAFRGADSRIRGFGAAAGYAGRQIGGGLMRGLSGVWTLLGGPWGAALAVAGTALFNLAQDQAKARAEAQAHTEALAQQQGQLGQLNAEIIIDSMADSGALARLKAADVDLAKFTATALEGKDAREALAAAYEAEAEQLYAQAKATEELVVIGETAQRVMSDEGVRLQQQADARGEAARLIRDEGNALDEVTEGYRLKQEAMEGVAGITEEQTSAINDLASALSLGATELVATAIEADTLGLSLTGAADGAEQASEWTGTYADVLSRVNPLLGEIPEEMDAATEALFKNRDELASSVDAFVDFGSAAEQARAASREHAEQLAEEANATVDWADEAERNTGRAQKTWEDFYDGESIDPERYLQSLRDMQEAEQGWADNLLSLVGRVPDAYIQELARMGPEGAMLVDSVANDFTAPQLRELEELYGTSGGVAGQQYNEGLASTLMDPRLADAFAAADLLLADNVNERMRQRIRDGEITIQDAIDQYDLDVPIELDTEPGERKYLGWVDEMGNYHPTPGLNVDTVHATGLVADWTREVEATDPTPELGLDDSWYRGVLADALTLANGSVGTPNLDADDTWYGQVLRAALREADGSVGTPDIDGDDDPFSAVLRGALRDADTSTGTIDLAGDTDKLTAAYQTWLTNNSGKKLSLTAQVTGSFLRGLASTAGNENGAIIERQDGGVDDQGRYHPRRSMLAGPRYGATNILWGEPITGREAYISDKPGMQTQNLAYLAEAARWFGATLTPHADGAVRDATIPASVDMSGTFDMADSLTRAAAAVVAASGIAGGGSGGPGGGGSRALAAFIRQNFADARITSTYRPGARTSTGYASKHGQDLAVDWWTPNMRRDAERMHMLMGARLSENYFSGWDFRRYGKSITPAWITVLQHWDHIHSAMENGGVLGAMLNPKRADSGFLDLDPGPNMVWNELGHVENFAPKHVVATQTQYAPNGYQGQAPEQAPPPDYEAMAAAAGAAAARETVAQLARTPITAKTVFTERDSVTSADVARRANANNAVSGWAR